MPLVETNGYPSSKYSLEKHKNPVSVFLNGLEPKTTVHIAFAVDGQFKRWTGDAKIDEKPLNFSQLDIGLLIERKLSGCLETIEGGRVTAIVLKKGEVVLIIKNFSEPDPQQLNLLGLIDPQKT